MQKRQRKQILLAQNFLRSPALVRRLVAASTIGPGDTVYDIGAGTGMITAELARRAQKVIAVEIDPVLARRLRERFRDARNVTVIEGNFLKLTVSVHEYKIF